MRRNKQLFEKKNGIPMNKATHTVCRRRGNIGQEDDAGNGNDGTNFRPVTLTTISAATTFSSPTVAGLPPQRSAT